MGLKIVREEKHRSGKVVSPSKGVLAVPSDFGVEKGGRDTVVLVAEREALRQSLSSLRAPCSTRP